MKANNGSKLVIVAMLLLFLMIAAGCYSLEKERAKSRIVGIPVCRMSLENPYNKNNKEIFDTMSFRNEDTLGKFEVRGDGVVFASPDIAVLNLGVLHRADSAAEAETLATSVMNRVLAFLRDSGIEEKDIQTSHYSISPEYSYNKNTRIPTGYNASCSMRVHIRKIDEAGKIFSQAVLYGANSNSGISYELSESKKHYREALLLALSDAAAKANEMAEFLQTNDLKLINVKEQHSGMNYGIRTMSVMSPEAASAAVMPGQIEVKASIEATYTF